MRIVLLIISKHFHNDICRVFLYQQLILVPQMHRCSDAKGQDGLEVFTPYDLNQMFFVNVTVMGLVIILIKKMRENLIAERRSVPSDVVNVSMGVFEVKLCFLKDKKVVHLNLRKR